MFPKALIFFMILNGIRSYPNGGFIIKLLQNLEVCSLFTFGIYLVF